MNNICHVCGIDDKLRHISDGDLLEKLKLLATIKLEENAPVPKHVCNTCKIGLGVPYQLHEQEVEAERKWQAKNETDEAQKSVEAVDEFIDDGEEFLNNEELLDDIKIEETQLMPATEDYVQYENVNTLAPSTVTEQQHKEAGKAKPVIQKKICWTHEYSVEFRCDVCGKTFKTEPSLDAHMTTHMSKEECLQKEAEKFTGTFRCEFCDKIFKNRCRHREHLRTHTNERPYKCNHCNQSFRTRSAVNTHLRLHVLGRPFECQVCLKRFGRAGELKVHKLWHEGKYPHYCDICNKGFSAKNRLRLHAKRHEAVAHGSSIVSTVNAVKNEDSKKQEELTEDKEATQLDRDHSVESNVSENALSSTLQCHADMQHEKLMSSHEYSLELKCAVCGEMFNTECSFDVHMTVHMSNEERRQRKIGPFPCAHCNKIFKHHSRRRDHQRRHTNERPYKCNRCKERFHTWGAVHSHVRVHTNFKPFQCQVCLRRFRDAWNLKVHSLRHSKRHEEPVHKCINCDRSYYFKSSLSYHIKKHHEKSKDGPENAISSSPVCQTESQHEKYKPDRHKTRTRKREYSIEFKCDLCEETFETESSWDDHMNFHVSNGDCPQKETEKLTGPFFKRGLIPKKNTDETQQNDMQIISKKMLTIINTSS